MDPAKKVSQQESRERGEFQKGGGWSTHKSDHERADINFLDLETAEARRRPRKKGGGRTLEILYIKWIKLSNYLLRAFCAEYGQRRENRCPGEGGRGSPAGRPPARGRTLALRGGKCCAETPERERVIAAAGAPGGKKRGIGAQGVHRRRWLNQGSRTST